MSWPQLFKTVVSGKYDKTLLKEYIHDLYKKTSLYSSVLHFGVLGGNIKTMKYLIAHGADVDERNVYGETPLHWCCKEGNIEIAKLLIENGCDIKTKDCDGNTPLHWAAEYNQHEIVSYLLSLNAPTEKKNSEGHTPMELAILSECSETVSILNLHITKSSSSKATTFLSLPISTTNVIV